MINSRLRQNLPSIGSTTNVGSGPSLVPGLYVSSPMKENSGYAVERRDETIFSTAWSTSVTISTAVYISRVLAHDMQHMKHTGCGQDNQASHHVQLSFVPVPISAGFADIIVRPASYATSTISSWMACKLRSAIVNELSLFFLASLSALLSAASYPDLNCL